MPQTRDLLALLLTALLGLGACAQSAAPGLVSRQERELQQAGLAGLLPAPGSFPAAPAGRSTASLSPSLAQEAADFRSELPNSRAVLDGDELVFNSGYVPGGPLAGAAFAVFTFSTPPPERQPELRVIWEQAPLLDSNVWLAAANFSTLRWDFLPALREESGGIVRHRIELGSWSPYTAGPAGQLHAAVLVTGSESCRLRRLRAGEAHTTAAMFSPPAGLAPHTVTGNNSLMSMPGSRMVLTQSVDFNGDGVADASGPAGYSGGSYIFNLPGTQVIRTTLSDDDGLSASYDSTIEVLQGQWDLQQLAVPDSADTTLLWPNSGVVNGRPALAYVHHDTSEADGDPLEYSVRYMIADIWPKPAAWLGPFTAYSTTDQDRPVAIGGVLDCYGHPGIFYRTDNGALFFVRGDAPEALNWDAPKFMENGLDDDSGISVGYAGGGDISFADPRPAVAYNFNAPFVGWTVWWRVADSNSAGGEWSNTLVGAGKGDIGLLAPGYQTPQLAVYIAEGQQPITHPAGGIIFYHGQNYTGESNLDSWIQDSIAYAGFGGQGQGPAICQLSGNNYFYAINNRQSPRAGGRLNVDITTGGDSGFQELGICDSFMDMSGPVLAYGAAYCVCDSDSSAGFGARDVQSTLSFIVANSNGQPVPPNSLALVDNAAGVGRHCSLSVQLGLPVIVYEDAASRSIKVAQLK